MRSFIKFLVIITILICFSFSQTLVAQDQDEKGKIEEFEKKLEKKKEEKTNENEKAKDDDAKKGKSFFGWLVGELIVKPVLFGLFIGSSGDDDSPYRVNLWNSYFSDYPYKLQNIGLYASPETSDKRFSMKLFGNYFYHSNDLQGLDMRARIFPFPFFGIALDFTDLNEKLETEEDHIQLYNITVNYNRVRSQYWAAWWGLGVKGVAGNNTHYGPAFNLGTEIYPRKPISLHLNYNIAAVNNRSVGELLLHLNYHFKRSIFYIGYHRYAVGSAKLNGAIAGIGFYL